MSLQHQLCYLEDMAANLSSRISRWEKSPHPPASEELLEESYTLFRLMIERYIDLVERLQVEALEPRHPAMDSLRKALKALQPDA